MVYLKPHTATVKPIGQAIDPEKLLRDNTHASGDPVVVQGFFQPLRPGESMMKWGVDLRAPGVFMCEVADAPSFGPDFEVSIPFAAGVKVYRCEGTPRVFDAGNEADHTDIVLEFKQYGALP